MPFAIQVARRSQPGGVVSIQDFLHAVANTEVGAVHVASHDEDHRDGQVVVGHIRQPEGLGLGMEPAQEGEDRRASAVGGAKHVVAGIGVLGHRRPSSR